MTTLHDIQTKCNKLGFMISLMLGEALEQLEDARERGHEFDESMIKMAIFMMLEEVDPIEE